MSTSENSGATAEVGIQCKFLTKSDIGIQCGRLYKAGLGTKCACIKCKTLPTVDVGVQCNLLNSTTTDTQPIQNQPRSQQSNSNTNEVIEEDDCCDHCLFCTLVCLE